MNSKSLIAPPAAAVQRIAIIKPTALGDVVQSLPLLPALRRRFPDAKISWVIHAGLADLLSGHPDLDEIIPYHRNGSWREWRTLLGALWSRKFDLVLDLQGLLRTGLMTLATRAPRRVGLETAREGSRWTLTHVVPNTDRAVPAWERYLRVLDSLDADRTMARTTLAVSQHDEHWAEQQLAHLSRPLIAVHPGARWETKRWPVEKFAELFTRAISEWQAGVVILGSPAERGDADKLEEQLNAAFGVGPSAFEEEKPSLPFPSAERRAPNAVLNLCGKTTLKQLTAILQRVAAVVSNDSGPMHLAAGLGTPTLGIFTCTDAVRSGPAGLKHETVSTRVACAGSYCKTCPHSGEKHLACFRELGVARVWLALNRLLEKNGIEKATSRAA